MLLAMATPKTPAKHLSNFLRLAICVAAMWFVLRGVKLNDRVVLRGGAQEITGTVTDVGDRISIHGQVRSSKTLYAPKMTSPFPL